MIISLSKGPRGFRSTPASNPILFRAKQMTPGESETFEGLKGVEVADAMREIRYKGGRYWSIKTTAKKGIPTAKLTRIR